jgi:hypothetical protein
MTPTSTPPRLPYALLGLLTLACFGGPFFLLVVRGGERGDWPPDRPIEWIVVALVFAITAGLFVACITLGLWYRWPEGTKKPARVPRRESLPSSGIRNSES